MQTKTSIEKVLDLLSPMANKFNPLSTMFWVTESERESKLDADNMEQHGGLEEYCEGCIERAVEDKYIKWATDRNVLMGQIYEAEQKGYYTRYGYSNSTNSKYTFRKIKIVNTVQIKNMKWRLRREYRIGHTFSKDSQGLCGYETDRFPTCESCGKFFDISLLVEDQELEHWENMDNDFYKEINSEVAWQLYQIFYEGGSEGHKLNNRVEKLAGRILGAQAKNLITA